MLRCATSAIALAFLLVAFVSCPGIASPASQRATIDRSGVLSTRDGLTLKVIADEGSIRIVPLDRGASPVVRYSVHVETDLRGNQAQQILDRYSVTAKTTLSGVEIVGALPPQPPHGAQFSVHFEIAVPANYNLDINTEVGDIETMDIGGTAILVTQGGNIRAMRIGRPGMQRVAYGKPVAKLVTEGGHIQVGDVFGDISAFTAGGHIVTGNISGEANLHTGGGHIHAAGLGGRAELVTEGGNISVGKAKKFVSVKTGGGQIDFGEVDGSVHAQTGGGGIRILYVAGPMEVESNQGSICLTRVASSVRAATGDGTITAWISPEAQPSGAVHLAGASQLSSGSGDIIVYLPRNLAANIETIVETGGEKQVEADPALAMNFNNTGGMVKGWAAFNGGGAPLLLKTTAGRIKLQFLDSQTDLRDSLIREQKKRLEEIVPIPPVGGPETGTAPLPPAMPGGPEIEYTWTRRFELQFLGGIREDSDVFQSHITSAPHPLYPLSARKGGVEGRVRLQVRLNQDGKVQVEKVVEGSEPSLVDAAIAAVKQWRGKPAWMNGKKVDVISTVTVDFKLR
ncbi:MAG: energy transducer TonB [Acidobacteria bacterium]|nr:energy transducer TonB [Acidobacteriota bacterium]MBS1864621.1 energy transducer TonB [Acidobacteriota bacterium]